MPSPRRPVDVAALERLAEDIDFSGVAVAAPLGGDPPVALHRGLADRAEQRPIGLATRFGIASGTKGFTAVTVASLIEDGTLGFDTPIVEVTGDDLPLADPAITVEHLLAHRSGVGDYLDEEQLGDIDDHVLGVSAHALEIPTDYLPLLAPHPQVSAPDERFAYNNSGYVILALIIERVALGGYHRAVRDRVFEPAGMTRTGFFRSDQPPPDLALGYLQDGRTNVFHLPVIGGGDGGAHSTGPDLLAFWSALTAGRIVSPGMVEALTGLRSTSKEGSGYGRGFWLDGGGAIVALEGMDAGVSFRSGFDHGSGWAWAVLANTSSGAWTVAAELQAALTAG